MTLFRFIVIVNVMFSFPLFLNAQLKGDLNKSGVKDDIQIAIGTNVIGFGGSTFVGTYISPSYRFNITPKLSINAGVNIGTFESFGKEEQLRDFYFYNMVIPAFSNYYYVEGSFAYSKNLTVSGSFTSSFPGNDEGFSGYGIHPGNNDWKSGKIGINYKITDGVHINAQFGYSNHPFIMNQSRNLNSFYGF